MVKPPQLQQPAMIVEVPVIGALALHVLFYVKEGSFSLFELPVKQLQFSPCPFHSIPASIHLDLDCMADFVRCMHSKDSQMIALCRKTPIFKKSSGGLRRHYYFYLGFPPGTAAFRRRDWGGIILRGIRRQSRAAHQHSNRQCHSCCRHPCRHSGNHCWCCKQGNEATTTPPWTRRNDYRLLYYYRLCSNRIVPDNSVHSYLHSFLFRTLQIQQARTSNRWWPLHKGFNGEILFNIILHLRNHHQAPFTRSITTNFFPC